VRFVASATVTKVSKTGLTTKALDSGAAHGQSKHSNTRRPSRARAPKSIGATNATATDREGGNST